MAGSYASFPCPSPVQAIGALPEYRCRSHRRQEHPREEAGIRCGLLLSGSLGQRIAGHRREWLENQSRSHTTSRAQDMQHGSGVSRTFRESPLSANGHLDDSIGRTHTDSHGTSHKESDRTGESVGRGQSFVPIHEDFLEVSRKTYVSFDDQRTEWAQKIRTRRTGEAFAKFRDDERLYDLLVDYHPIPDTPRLLESVEELIQRNFTSDVFVSKAYVETEGERLRESLLRQPPITIPAAALQNLEYVLDAPSPLTPKVTSPNENRFA
ncbi:MAG: hypothetical protein NTY19_24325 [Planctomycetota bacterium]|nr:hypothetical protein [Planctomycetota bacterium]